MKHVALFGGAFNPPHAGHVLVAEQILDFTDVDEVWLLPNYGQNYYGGAKPHKSVASVEERLAMTRLLEQEKIKISTLEIDHKLDGQTIKIIPFLPPEHRYSFIIGSDQLPSFPLWSGWQDLLSFMTFFVFPRYGFSIEPLYDNMKCIAHELLVETNISSTKIRERVKQGKSIHSFVPESVEQYIKEHGLYLL